MDPFIFVNNWSLYAATIGYICSKTLWHSNTPWYRIGTHTTWKAESMKRSVLDGCPHYLESRVNEKIRSGWAPTGGIAVKPPDRQFKDMEGGFYQAMVREAPLEPL